VVSRFARLPKAQKKRKKIKKKKKIAPFACVYVVIPFPVKTKTIHMRVSRHSPPRDPHLSREQRDTFLVFWNDWKKGKKKNPRMIILEEGLSFKVD